MNSGKEQPYYGFSIFTRHLICTTTNAILLITCIDYVQVKTLMRLQKTIAGGDEKLIIKFMWPLYIKVRIIYRMGVTSYVLRVLASPIVQSS